MKLQLALDAITYESALDLLKKTHPWIDYIELGTPFAYTNPLSAIGDLKKTYPYKKIFADYKILDGGKYMAMLAYNAGADMVSVSASANYGTVKSAVEAARESGNMILIDFMGVPLERIKQRAAELASLKPDYVCVHISVEESSDPFAAIKEVRKSIGSEIQVAAAGGINLDSLDQYIEANPDLLIVGSAITTAKDPESVVKAIKEKMQNAGA